MAERTLSRAERFFERRRVEYKAARDGLSVKIVMEGAKLSPLGGSPTYDYSGGIFVEHGSGQLETGVSFHYNYQTFSFGGHIGVLFDRVTRNARIINSAMHAAGNISPPEVDTLAECLFEIRQQARGEFLQEQQHDGSFVRGDLWEKYFKPHIKESTDD